MSEDAKRPLGKILLQKKLVSQQDLDSALKAQKRTGDQQPLASRLTESGMLDDIEALRALSEQHGVPGIDLAQVAIQRDHLELIPQEVADSRLILCVLSRGERLFLAMANPQDRRVVDEVEFVTGRKVYPYVALTGALRRTIADAYEAATRGDPYYLGPRVPDETLKQLGVARPAPRSELLPPPSEPLPSPALQAVDPRAQFQAAAAPPPAPPQIELAVDLSAGRGGYASSGLELDVPANSPLASPPFASRPPIANSPLRGFDPPPADRDVGPPPGLVVDDQMRDFGGRAEMATGDFGNLGEEVSAMMQLPADLRAAPGTGINAQNANGKLILVVDDEEEIRRLLTRLLTGKGFRVIEADRGQLALRMVKEHSPDAIILDAMLPEIHGFDIARRIKGSERYGRIPIVMISAVYKGWRIAEDLKSNYGIDAYLEKPFKISEVIGTLNRVIAAAIDPTSAAATRDPEALHADAERMLNEGIAAYKRGEIDVAIGHLKRGIDIDPLAYRLHFHLALLLGKKGLIYEGIQELERAVDLNPKHFAAQKNLAVLYEKAGFKHKAVEVWTRCAQIAPDEETRASVKVHLLELL